MDRKKWSEKDYLDLERIDPEFPQELIDSFIKPDIPPYNTVEIVGIRVLRTDSIVVQNANGQVVNLERGIGTEKEFGIESNQFNPSLRVVVEPSLSLLIT